MLKEVLAATLNDLELDINYRAELQEEMAEGCGAFWKCSGCSIGS